METWIALLRGINVGGNNSLKMQDLRSLLANLNYATPRTYIQSGNCVFQSAESDANRIAGSIGAAIEQKHGFRPKVLVLALSEFESALESSPYRDVDAEPKTIHFFFLSQPTTDADLEALNDLRADSEDFSLTDKVFYLLAPEGIGRSKLAAKAETILGVATTARNLNSVRKIADLARAES